MYEYVYEYGGSGSWSGTAYPVRPGRGDSDRIYRINRIFGVEGSIVLQLPHPTPLIGGGGVVWDGSLRYDSRILLILLILSGFSRESRAWGFAWLRPHKSGARSTLCLLRLLCLLCLLSLLSLLSLLRLLFSLPLQAACLEVVRDLPQDPESSCHHDGQG